MRRHLLVRRETARVARPARRFPPRPPIRRSRVRRARRLAPGARRARLLLTLPRAHRPHRRPPRPRASGRVVVLAAGRPTVHADACACRTTFANASDTIRYAATSTAAETSSIGHVTVDIALRRPSPPLSRWASWSTAPTNPSSSSAGGRRSWTRRRTSWTMLTTSLARLASTPSARALSLRGQVASRLDPQPDPGQRRTETVVQISSQPAALLLASDHECFATGLQFAGQPGGAGRRRGLSQHVTEQTPGPARSTETFGSGASSRLPTSSPR